VHFLAGRAFDCRPPLTEERGLQRFFSTFPGGWPAVGLLLLRTVAGGAAAGHGGIYLAHSAEPAATSWALGLLAILSGI
jgi:hypothetical protein